MLPRLVRHKVAPLPKVKVPVWVSNPLESDKLVLTIVFVEIVTPPGLLIVRPVKVVGFVPPMVCRVVPLKVVAVVPVVNVPLLVKSPPKVIP